MRASNFRDWVKLNTQGRFLLQGLATHLSTTPVDNPQQRQQLQKQASTTLLKHLNTKLHLHGLEHATGGPYLIAALHESLVDPICLMQLPLAMRFVVRDNIFNLEKIGPAIRNLGHIAMNLEDHVMLSYRKILRQARPILASGESLVLFPQGSVLGIETDFQPGAFALCKTLGIPMLPVVLTGTHKIWEHPFKPTLRYNTEVFMQVLAPIPAATFQNKQTEIVRAELRDKMKQIALTKNIAAARNFIPERDGWWDGYHFEIDPSFTELHKKILARRNKPNSR